MTKFLKLSLLACLGILGIALIMPTPNAPETAKPKMTLEEFKALEKTWQQPTPKASATQLELQAMRFTINHGFAYVEGQVKNVSGESLKNVMAVATFTDKDDGFITSDQALIEYNPILSEQVSPYRVVARANPAMAAVRVEFKQLGGGTLRMERK